MRKRLSHPSTVFALFTYVLLSAVWIVTGDILVRWAFGDTQLAQSWQTAKGLLFVVLSAGVLAWFGVQRDRAEAQERREAAALRDSEQRYHTVFQGGPTAKLLTDAQSGQVIDANPAALRFYGFTHEQLVNLHISDLGVLNAGQGHHALTHALQGDQSHFEVEHRLKDGSTRPVQCTVSHLELQGRDLLYWRVKDITDRRRADLAVRTRAAALEAAPHGIVITDVDGHVEWVNQAFTTMTGYSTAEVIGETLSFLKSGRQDDDFYRHLWSTVKAGHVWRGELVNRRKDGSLYYEEQSITPVRDELGALRHFVAIKQDVTDNHKVHDEREHRARQQRALVALGETALSRLGLSKLVQQATEAVADLLQVDLVTVLRLTPKRDSFVVWAGFGWEDGIIGQVEVENSPSTLPGFTLRSGEPVVSIDLRTETRFTPAPVLLEHGVVSSASVFLDYGQETFGIMAVHSKSRCAFSQSDVSFIQSAANVLAAAIRQRKYEEEIEDSNVQILEAYDDTIEGWARALDLRDHETEGHSRRVTDLSVALGQAFGLDEKRLLSLRRGALLHDIGKMGVPDAILHKPGPLTEEEWVVMRAHTVLAQDLLRGIWFLRDATDVPYCHHEKWDGTGYPRGLVGEAIPLNARIFAVVDVYDALTSDRPYRKAWSRAKALNHIQSQAGKHFDPAVVDAFMSFVGDRPDAPRPGRERPGASQGR